MSSWVVIFPSLQKLKEFLRPSLFEESHQRAFDGLHFGTGNFGYLPIAVDEAAGDLLKLQIAGNIRMNKNFSELSRGDDEFWDEIDGIITVATKLSRGWLVWSEFTVQLSGTVSCFSLERRK